MIGNKYSKIFLPMQMDMMKHEADALSDAALKANFGYTDAGIANLRSDAKEIREMEKVEKKEENKMSETELIKEYIQKNAENVVAEYFTASWGERLGFYIDAGIVSHAVGHAVGNEIAFDERPVVMLKCPGIGNVDSHFWLACWTHENEEHEIVVDETGEIISFTEAIERCCRDGDILSCSEGLQEDVSREIDEIEREKEE